MSALAVKYCPVCDSENPSFASFCQDDNCAGDLINAPVVPRRDLLDAADGDDAMGAMLLTPEPEPIELEMEPLNLDELEAEPPPRPMQSEPMVAAQSAARDEDGIATVRATNATPNVLELELVENPNVRFKVRSGQSVGRAAKADVVLLGVPDLAFISRAHARFQSRRGQWYVQYIAEGNFIKVDNVEYSDDSEIAIYENSIVVLSLTSFRVCL